MHILTNSSVEILNPRKGQTQFDTEMKLLVTLETELFYRHVYLQTYFLLRRITGDQLVLLDLSWKGEGELANEFMIGTDLQTKIL